MPVLPFQGVKHMGATSYQGVALRCRVLAPLARNNHKSCKITDDTGFRRTPDHRPLPTTTFGCESKLPKNRQCRNCSVRGSGSVHLLVSSFGTDLSNDLLDLNDKADGTTCSHRHER